MKYLLALSLAATVLAGPALAQTRTPARTAADTNRDAVLTRAEATAASDRRFAMFDTDHDGTVTPAERQAVRRQRADRVVTAAEFQAKAQTRFARLDADHDGKLTGDERRAGRPMRRGHHGGPRGAADRTAMAQPVTAADFRTRALARFDRMDANRDGRIDQTERTAAHGHHDMARPTEG